MSNHRSKIPLIWQRRYFYPLLVIAILLCSFIAISIWSTSDQRAYAAARQCFRHDDGDDDNVNGINTSHTLKTPPSVRRLPDILARSTRRPTPGRTVFFHETSCRRPDGLARLNARQACAIESAALSSSDWDVFVLFAAPVGFLAASNRTGDAANDRLMEALRSYGNVHMRTVDLWSYAEGTPLAGWMRSEALLLSRYLNSHASDLLRYLSLYKWGGTYLDLDVVLMKNLSTIPANYAGAESTNFVAAGVINFDHQGVGHAMAEKCLLDFRHNFDGNDWGNNGPGVITRVLQRICRTAYPPLMTRTRCDGFEVFDVPVFYAVRWMDWRHFFDPSHSGEVLRLMQNSYAAHVWNKHSHAERVRVGSQQAYGLLAAKYCPRVYAAAGEFF